MIPAECHLQGQLFTLIKCPELLGQICWTVKQKPLSRWWLISPGLLGGDGIFCQVPEQRSGVCFSDPAEMGSRMRSGETSSIKGHFPSSTFF